jgi:DNA mismatch repair ATPase MutS
VNTILLFDANAAYFGGRELRERSAELLRVIDAVGDIDAAIAVASFRAGTEGWTRPVRLAERAAARLTDVRHVLVPDAVPNSVALGPPHGVIVTGSNMSGKSTFLRTVGTTMVMAQTINTCLASRYEAPAFMVRSCIGRNDDIMSGKSYYIVEVESVLSLVRASETTAAHLFLFDELFRGTNAVERIAAGEAVLTQIGQPRDGAPSPHIVIAATHDHELVDLLQGLYAPYHFTDTVGPEGLVFEYRLQSGPATTRNAITLLQLNGAPPELVERAMRRAAVLDLARRDVMAGSRGTS